MFRSCQGNLLLAFQNAATVNPNPTRHLLSLLSSDHLPSLGKDKEFFLGFLGEDDAVRRVVRILSGDPSRGGMALDCEESVEPGDRVVVSPSSLRSSRRTGRSTDSVVGIGRSVPASYRRLKSPCKDLDVF